MWDLHDSSYPTCSELRGSLTYGRFDDCLSHINAYFHRWARIGYPKVLKAVRKLHTLYFVVPGQAHREKNKLPPQ